ncbi:type II toxin-antitoxin system VapB family antitoxin [Leptospira sp. GIMC2001]|uniref:type II toxin-antitoxin system VapB family antitoxin n=1 Tax=Leptospira sp. GIMC2001 TaxID=1513297 RepID=UPI002349D6F9|nr:type II toxin-antitoxin system VapB family antitoxin [Leptospira sp. GIMC2001]WCL50360.1 type II toxin-antitoxin system VapB family antitoxin [Leptospira sp. GIMC2001]
MATNLNIDNDLLNQAYSISGLKSKKDTVNLALKEFIKRYKQDQFLNFINNVEYDENYNYKKIRDR